MVFEMGKTFFCSKFTFFCSKFTFFCSKFTFFCSKFTFFCSKLTLFLQQIFYDAHISIFINEIAKVFAYNPTYFAILGRVSSLGFAENSQKNGDMATAKNAQICLGPPCCVSHISVILRVFGKTQR